MSNKRITFNTATPNDQGGVIPNDVIQFDRFDVNPVLLLQHQWEKFPVGLMTDRQLIDGKWTGIPDFHRITEESKICYELYINGYLKACSIGGFSEWETNAAGQTKLDKDGNRICAFFDLYEVSICTLPSNKDAVTMAANEALNYAQIYDRAIIQNVENEITTLSSQIKNRNVETKTPEKEAAEKLDAAEKEVTRLKAEKEKIEAKAGGASEIPGELPTEMKNVLSFTEKMFALFSKKGKEEAAATPPAGDGKDPKVKSLDPLDIDLDDKITLKAKKVEAAKKKADDAKEKAQDALEKAKEAKTKADADDATDEMKSDYKSKTEAAKQAVKDAEEMDSKHKEAMEADDEGEDDDDATTNAAKPEKKKTINSARKPILKTMAELKDEQVKLAATPQRAATIGANVRGLTFSALHARAQKDANSDEGRIYNRVMQGAESREIGDYAVLLNSIISDPKYAAIVEKARFNQNLSQAQYDGMVKNPKTRGGQTIEDLAMKLNSGRVMVWGKDNVFREQTTLTSTDNLLASPDLFAVEWLPLAIFALFPSDDWKKDIPTFAAEMTKGNTGVIWTNIGADPEVYKGTKPTVSDYIYSDVAVSLTMPSYWLQPMLWTPNTMHQFRYDMMGTGWAQGMAKWGAVIDDNLIYTLAASVPVASYINTSGQQVTINAQQVGPNQFYWNKSFTGSILNAAYNDIFALEQNFKNQNFELDKTKPVLVLDPIAERGLKQDPDTKSLLTRFIESDKSEILVIGNTEIISRSRLAIYDPATQQVKDPNASIPSTAVGSNLSFIPSQVGIGIGTLDVFQVQDPAAYGYRMSADIRAGIANLRENGNGIALYNYGAGNV